MRRSFWTRLISAVVTMAMVFSVLAMPASAASANQEEIDLNWAMGTQVEDEIYMWIPATYILEDALKDMEIEGEVTPEIIEGIKKSLEGSGLIIRNVSYDTDAFYGFSKDADEGSTIYWYTEAEWDRFVAAVRESNETGETEEIVLDANGRLVAKVDGKTVATGAPIGYKETSSADGSALGILAVVGVGAAAATGVYLYTHPEKVQEIKDFFADLSANVQAKVQAFSDNVKSGVQGILPGDEAENSAEAQAA